MDSDQGKLFVGGISWETDEEKLKEHFGKYGEVLQAVTMRDKATGRPRGFGFVVFADPSLVDNVLLEKHVIDGRTVEAKKAMSREEQHTSKSSYNTNGVRYSSGTNSFRTKKIFVGGLPPTVTEDGFRQYFENYGHVTDVVVMYDQHTQRPRGFGFISYDSEDAVDRVLHKTFHELNGKFVEVKRALPKDANPGMGSRSGGAGYQGYGGSGVNSNSYDGRSEGSRYIQPQAAAAGFPAYNSSGYSGPGYGYGPTSNAVGYGYGVGGYGPSGVGFGGPPAAYGNPNAGPGFPSGPANAPRSPWSGQAPSGFGSGGYSGGASYGSSAGWTGAPGGGGPPGSSSIPSGYGNQGYGFGGYGGNEAYGTQAGYGATGGRGSASASSNDQTNALGGYAGSGYGSDVSGNSGYPNAAWRSENSQPGYGSVQGNGPSAAQVGYGGYGSQPRQAQS